MEVSFNLVFSLKSSAVTYLKADTITDYPFFCAKQTYRYKKSNIFHILIYGVCFQSCIHIVFASVMKECCHLKSNI